MSLSKERQAVLMKGQCKEQKRGDWAKKKTWYDKALALDFFKQDRKDIRAILEEAEARGEYLPLLDNETPFGGLANEFERVLLPCYFRSKDLEAKGLDVVFREISEEEEEIFFSESSLISTKKLFKSLIKQAGDNNSWIKEKDLPLYLRFAIKRPLMSELHFCRALEILDLTLDFGREGGISPIDNGPPGLASSDSEEDDARQFRENRQALMNVYGLVQDGMVDSEAAYQHYREILGYMDVDKETLIASLQNYGIPVTQTPSPGRSAPREPATQIHPGTQTTTFTQSLEQTLPIDEGSMQIIEELSNLIKLYRSRHVTLVEVIKLIYERLDPYQPKRGVIKDYVKGSRAPDDAAHNLWEEAAELNSDDNEDDDDDDDDDNDDHNDNEEDGAASKSDEDSKSNHNAESHPKTNLPESRALNGHDDQKTLEPTNGKSIAPGSLIGPPARLLRKSRSPARDTGMRGQRQDTPILDAVAPVAGDSESHRRGRGRGRTRTRGQKSSVTASSSLDPIFYVQTGCRMPTKRARRIAYGLGLPYDYLRYRFRKRLAREEKKEAEGARLPVLLPKSKRKASDVAGQSRPRKTPRLKLFVKPRDTNVDSGSTLERGDVTESKTSCPTCLHHPCHCSTEPPKPLELESRCPKCQQRSCSCVESLWSPNRDQKADADESTHVDFNDIGQYSGSPYPVLAYLSRIWEARNIFHSFIRIGFGNPTEAMRESAYSILAEIGLGINLGEIEDCITKKDVNAVAVLQRLQGGLREAALLSTKRDSSKSKSIKGARTTESAGNKIQISEDKALTSQQAKENESDANSETKSASPDIAAYSDLAGGAESLPFTVSNFLPAIAGSQMLIEIGKGILSGKLKSSTERDKTADAVLRHTEEALHEVLDCEEMRDQNSVAARNAGSASLPSHVDRSLSEFPEAGNAVNPSRNAESDPCPAQINSPPSKSHDDPKPMSTSPNGDSLRGTVDMRSSSSASCQDPHPVMSHLSRITKNLFIIPRLMKLGKSAKISRPEVEWMKTLLEAVQKGMRCGAIKGPRSKVDIAAVSTMQRILRDHSSRSLPYEKENTPPGGIDINPVPPKLPNSNPVLAYLTRVLEDQKSEDSTLQFLRNLERNPTCEGTKGEVERIVGVIEQGIRTKEIDGSGYQTWKDIDACDILDRLYEKCKPLHACGPHADIWSATEPAKADSAGTGKPEGPKDSNLSSGAPTQDLSRGQHSSPSSDIAREMEGESHNTNTQVESLEGSMKLTPSLNVSRSPTNEFLLSSGIPVIPEAGHPEPKGAEDSSTPPPTTQSRSYGISRPAGPVAESIEQNSDSPLSPWTTPYEFSTYKFSVPKNPYAESGLERPEPHPTPRQRPNDSSSPITSVAESSFESPKPPPTPQLKAKELPGPTIPTPKSFSQRLKRKNMSSKGRAEEPPASDMFKDMTADECFEYFQNVASREQRSFSSVMAERRAIRKRPGEADYRYFFSFFQISNGGAPNLAATLSKLFDKYRGKVSMPKIVLNIVLNSARQSERRTRQDRCRGFDEIPRRPPCQTG